MLATPYLTARLPGPRRPGPPLAQQPRGGGDSGTPDGVTLTGRAAPGPPPEPGPPLEPGPPPELVPRPAPARDPGRGGRDPAHQR